MLMDESRDGVSAWIEKWREALESKGFKISCTKMEYMNCNFWNIWIATLVGKWPIFLVSLCLHGYEHIQEVKGSRIGTILFFIKNFSKECVELNLKRYHKEIHCDTLARFSKDGKIEENVKHRIRERELKWKLALGVLCNWLYQHVKGKI